MMTTGEHVEATGHREFIHEVGSRFAGCVTCGMVCPAAPEETIGDLVQQLAALTLRVEALEEREVDPSAPMTKSVIAD
jgi:hypothetical protein